VDDDEALRDLLIADFSNRGYAVRCDDSLSSTLARLNRGELPDVLITDLNLGDGQGLDLIDRMHALAPEVPVIVITAFGSIESAVAAIRRGAYDFITKPFDCDVLALTVERALERRRLSLEVEALRERVEASQRFHQLVGQSAPMRRVFDLVKRVAQSEATVLIEGESGTGKELVARAIHASSRRGSGPFMAVNCGALPEALLESELFGHLKGAFTDARTERVGLFREAQGGTLFLDEVGELPLALQVKLLRAVQERKVRPVGSDKEVPFDARILSATNQALDAAVAEKRFRQDLFYRLNVVRVELPPLRERGTDVLLLANELLHQQRAASGGSVTGFSDSVLQTLMAWTWPGNVRELKNVIEHGLAMAKGPLLELGDLPLGLRRQGGGARLSEGFEPVSLGVIELRHIRRMVEHCGGNKRKAAELLGIDRTTLYRKLLAAPGDAPASEETRF
jgi:DNA-binding NtrC family response regulator